MGGEQIFNGCKYQTLTFLYELLKNNSKTGKLEEKDDYYISCDDKNICGQTKELEDHLTSSNIKTFILNFMEAQEEDSNIHLHIFSPKGISKKVNYQKMFENLNLTPDKKELFEQTTSKMEDFPFTRTHLYSEIKRMMHEIASCEGAIISSNELDPIIGDLLNQFMDLNEVYFRDVLEQIKTRLAPYIGYHSKEEYVNTGDLAAKKSKEYSPEEIDNSIHQSVEFKRFAKRLSGSNPVLSAKLNTFFTRLDSSFNGEEKTYDQFIGVYNSILNNESQDFRDFLDDRKNIKEEIFNVIIGGCSIYPKK